MEKYNGSSVGNVICPIGREQSSAVIPVQLSATISQRKLSGQRSTPLIMLYERLPP